MKVIEYLKETACETARLSGLELRVDRSALSEAVYLKVRRPRPWDGAWEWFGIRVAAHPPVYSSSRDSSQVLVPPDAREPDEVRAQAVRVAAEVLVGGQVIADPDEVDAALALARRAARDRAWKHGPRETCWEWCEAQGGWRLVQVRARRPRPDEEVRYAEYRPSEPPVVRLSAEAESSVRHRLNERARWTHEELETWVQNGARLLPPEDAPADSCGAVTETCPQASWRP